MVKKILFISIDGITDPLGQSQVLPYMVGLAQKGFQITIISAEKRDRFLSSKNLIDKIVVEAKIHWKPVNYFSTIPLLSPILNFLRLRRACFHHASKNEMSIVHCRSYLASLIGIKIKKKYQTKFIFDMRGFFADERLDGGIWDKNNMITRNLYYYFKRKELEFLKYSDFTVSLTEAAKNEITKWPGLPQNLKIQVIPCCVDLALFSINKIEKTKQKCLRQQLKIESDDFVLSYLGSVGTWYMLDEMLEFFWCLQTKYLNAKFLIVTQDPAEIILKKAKEKNIESHQIIVIKANRMEVPLLLSLSTISIFFIKPTFSKMASSPTKMGEILAMGIPIVTNTGVGDIDHIINESKCGLVLENFNSKAYKVVIEKIPILLERSQLFYSETAIKYFSLEQGIQKYVEIYNAL